MEVPFYTAKQGPSQKAGSSSRLVQISERDFESPFESGARIFGEKLSEWANTKHDMAVESQSAAAGSALTTHLDELVRQQSQNPDPHAADAEVERESQQIYKRIMSSPMLQSGAARSAFSAKWSGHVAETLRGFREKNDERILKNATAEMDLEALNKSQVVMNTDLNPNDRIRAMIDIFGNDPDLPGEARGQGGSFLGLPIPVETSGTYRRGVERGILDLAAEQARLETMRKTIFAGTLANLMSGADDPSEIIIDLETGVSVDPVLQILSDDIDPSDLTKMYDDALSYASKIEKARNDQEDQDNEVKVAAVAAMKRRIFNTDDKSEALMAYDELRETNEFTPDEKTKAERYLKTRGWLVRDGESMVLFRTEDPSDENTIFKFQNLDNLNVLSFEVVNDAADAGLLTQADYITWSKVAATEQTDAERGVKEKFKTKFRYEALVEASEILGDAPMRAYMDSVYRLREFFDENPTAKPSEIRQEATEIMAEQYKIFVEAATIAYENFVVTSSVERMVEKFGAVGDDPVGWAKNAIAGAREKGDRRALMKLLNEFLMFRDLGVEFK